VETLPAPAALVRDFINTVDLEDARDDLDGPEALARWLTERGLLRGTAAVTDEDVALAARLRESLRAVLRALHHGGSPSAELERANALAAELPLVVRFGTGGDARVTPGDGGARGALAAILAGVAESVADGTWERLKVCAADDCQWAFYDRSRNRSGRWCSMAVCGNRSKTRTYRRRQSA
jgi:predicted RNA-binding Zn ribbon-like protein